MNRNLIIAFAPGSRGFLLSKWLYNNRVVRTVSPPSNQEYIFDGDNHQVAPFYNDVLFTPTDQTKIIYDKINDEIIKDEYDYVLLKKLIKTSKQKPPIINDLNQYNLILSHHSSYTGLATLGTILNAKIIRITLADTEQAKQCYQRKFNKIAKEQWLSTSYYPFIDNFDFAINIKLGTIEKLELDFLLKELA